MKSRAMIAVLAPAAALMLSACAHTGGSSATPPPASAFNPVERPAGTFADPLAAAQHFAQYRPGFDGGSAFDLLSRRAEGSQSLVMVFSVDGYADDSVRGEQWRIVVESVTGGWRVAEAGVRYRCWRGANPEAWRKELCA